MPPRSEPLVESCDQHGRLVANSELVVPRGDSTVSLEAVDPALDRMTLTVVSLIELRWSTAAGAELPPVPRLVGLVGDGAANPAVTQVGAVLAGGVGPVRPHPIRADPRPTRSDTGHADPLQNNFELRRVPRCPAVTTIDIGFCPCSTAR